MTINRRAHCLQILVQKINLLLISCVLQSIFQQQVFVRRRSNLGAENSIIAVDIGLRLTAEEAVQCMTHFVRQRRNTVIALLIVQQNEGMHAINAPRICAGALALVFIYVNPALRQTFMQRSDIFLTQRRQCLLNPCTGLREGAGKAVSSLRKRHIHIIIMELVYAQHIFFELNIFMQRCKVIMHRGNQAVIKARRNIILGQSCLQRILIVMDARIEVSTACAARQRSGQSIAILVIRSHQAAEGVFTQLAVGRSHIQQIIAFTYGSRLAFAVRNLRELHICAYESTEGTRSRPRRQTTLCRDGLLIG